MKRLDCAAVVWLILLFGAGGCTKTDEGPGAAPGPAEGDERLTDQPPADAGKPLADDGEDPVQALRRLGARLKQDDEQRVTLVDFRGTELGDEGLPYVSRLPHLRDLYLEGTPVTDRGLVHLRGLDQLDALNLAGTPITDQGLQHVGHLGQLRYLWLNDTSITNAGLQHLKRLPNLRYLWLENTAITDAGLHHLSTLRSLELLWLEGPRVSEYGVVRLQQSLPNTAIAHQR